MTGDRTLVFRHYPGILSAIRWFSAFESEDGLLTDLPYWNYCDTGVSRAGREGDFYRGGAVAFSNLFYAEAMASVVVCAKIAGDEEAVSFFTEKRRKLVDAIRRVFWSREKGAYIDCVTEGVPSDSVSETVNAMAILQAETDPERRASILRSVFTPETRREDVVEASVYSMILVARALKALDSVVLSVRIFLDRYREMLRAGTDTTWEYWWLKKREPDGTVRYGSACHAWGAAAIVLIAENVLGLSPESTRLPAAIPEEITALLGEIRAEIFLPGGRIFRIG